MVLSTTSIFPVKIPSSKGGKLVERNLSPNEQLAVITGQGLGYGIHITSTTHDGENHSTRGVQS